MIKIIKTGWYHPSNANWCYGVHMIIDQTGARMYKETFGGDDRIAHRLRDQGFEIEKISAGWGSNAEYKWGDIKGLPDIETYNGFNWGDNSNNQ